MEIILYKCVMFIFFTFQNYHEIMTRHPENYQWENWSLAQQGSEIHFDFSVAIKEIKKKKKQSRELFRGENICHRGQNESPTK